MVLDYYGKYTGTLRTFLITLVHPLEFVSVYPKRTIKWINEDIQPFKLGKLKSDNQQLKIENLLLRYKILELERYKQEAVHLEKLLGTSTTFNSKKVKVANVIYSSGTPLSQFIDVDMGESDGVKQRQSVIDAYGILGQVISVSAFSSRVLLLTDPEHQIPVRLRRTSQRGILTGIGHDKLKLNFIPKESSIKEGDLIESSGLGEVFPAGYPIAQVEKVRSSPEKLYLDVLAKPTAKISLSYKVLIITPTSYLPYSTKIKNKLDITKKINHGSENE